MQNKKLLQIETLGFLNKQERLTNVENNIIPNTLVLESLHPFPGYFGNNLPDKSEPHSLFLVTTKAHHFEEVARITEDIKKTFKHDFNACNATLQFEVYQYPAIRIKYLKRFEFLPELQKKYQAYGIRFRPHKETDEEAVIKVNKHFTVEELEPDIYRDMDGEYKCYVALPERISWEDFVKVTHTIKNNIDNNIFDAAIGAIYRKNGIVNMVRIYDKEKNVDRTRKIKDMYHQEIKQLRK